MRTAEHVLHTLFQSLIGLIEGVVRFWFCLEDAEKCCEHFDVSLMQFTVIAHTVARVGNCIQQRKTVLIYD